MDGRRTKPLGSRFAPTVHTTMMPCRYSPEPLTYENKRHDPAHILFTSGSTGTPKGVVISHANVIHFVEWAVRYFGMAPSDRNSGHPPLPFDLSVFDIFGTFAAGAQLFPVPGKLNVEPHKLADFIRDNNLTQWFSVPSLLHYMAKFDVVRPNDFPALKRVLWCGEVFPTSSLIYWMKRLPHVQFTNLYGPTGDDHRERLLYSSGTPGRRNSDHPDWHGLRRGRIAGLGRQTPASGARRGRGALHSRRWVEPGLLERPGGYREGVCPHSI